MKRALPFLLLWVLAGCSQYIKPRVAIDLTNKSHQAIRNIEVDFPGGSYGLTSLDVYGTNHHMAEIDHQACLITVKFEDAGGHAMGGKQINLGNPCPSKISIEVDSQMAVSAEPGK